MRGAGRASLLFLLALSPVAPLPSAAAAEPGRALVPRGRWHLEAPGPPEVRWSVLFRRSDAEDETRLLVETPGGRWSLLSKQPASGSDTREEVTDTALGETVSRVLTHAPVVLFPECASVRPPDACLVLEGTRGRLAAPLSAFSKGEAAALRRKASAVVSPDFLRRLRGLAPALPIADLAFYSEDFLALLDPALARPKGPPLVAPRRPGCTFDASFGWPCTPDERRREEWLFRRPAVVTPERTGARDEGGRGPS
ncbi:MAG TPA: hypothetical protein P5164_11255 [Thermoanaerobaculia bacterium]|nr:hypothetical protein [Thermoanaerobaculia bacterium]